MSSPITASYLILVAIWSTTALAIKWGVTGIPFTQALLIRFSLAAALAALILIWKKQSLPLTKPYLRAYAIAGTATSFSMLCSFWAAQYIASGLIAVLYGLTPLVTAFLSARWLNQTLAHGERIAIAFGLLGLIMIFGKNLNFSPSGLLGIGAILLGMSLQASAAVLLKRYTHQQEPVIVNAGALMLCAIICTVFWLLAGLPQAAHWPSQSLAALLYLASVGSVLAFSLYYWLIRECSPISVALISLITPASSLWLGHSLNHEVVHWHELLGTGCILLGLIIHSRLRLN